MATIIVRSYEDLTTLERGYISNPIDMPEAETLDAREYGVSVDDFLRAYRDWNRENRPMLELEDQISQSRIWLSQRAVEKVYRAVKEAKDSVELF